MDTEKRSERLKPWPIWPFALPLFLVAMVAAWYIGKISFTDDLPIPGRSSEAVFPFKPAGEASVRPVAQVPAAAPAPVESSVEPKVYTVRKGDELSKVFPKTWRQVCKMNSLANCNRIQVGQELELPADTEAKQVVQKPIERLTNGYLPLARLNVDPYRKFRTTEKDRKILESRGYTKQEIEEFFDLERTGACQGEMFGKEARFLWMSHGDARVTEKLVAAWQKPESGKVCVLSSGRTVVVLDKCGNLTEVPPREVTPPPVEVPPPPSPEPSPPEPPVEEPPEPIDDDVVYLNKPKVVGNCDFQAGIGVYANQVWAGRWAYAEGILCWKDIGDGYQTGVGPYLMYGSGHSLQSSFRGKELGIGGQVGLQRNWVNDKNRLATAETKLRYLWDRESGHNSEGYSFKQTGRKLGVYAGYAEKNTKDDSIRGVQAEWWRSLNGNVTSTWKDQPVKDRGSWNLAGYYQFKIDDDFAWRTVLRAAYTNWDRQLWLGAIGELRWRETVMCGPQITVPLGVSKLNKPLTVGQMTTKGVFCRLELRKQILEADERDRAGQYEFVVPVREGKNGAGEDLVPPTLADAFNNSQ